MNESQISSQKTTCIRLRGAFYRIWIPYNAGNMMKSCTSIRCAEAKNSKIAKIQLFYEGG